MNIETCIKYFGFLNHECDRYLNGGITDEEIQQLKIETDRFIELVMNSDLPFSLKQKIAAIKLEYSYNSMREYLPLLGGWDLTRHKRQRERRKKVEDLKFQIKDLPRFIQLNYA